MMKESPARRFVALLLLVVMIMLMGTVALPSAAVAISPTPEPPEIWYNPTSFSFTATEGDPNLSDTLWIRNDGDGSLDWSVSDDADGVKDWLSLDPTTGSSTGEMDEVTLLVDISGMSAGSYSATITIEAPGATNSPQTASVSLTINPPPGPPEIWHNPTSFSFTATEGDPNLSDTLWIRNDGDGSLDWSVSDDADGVKDWLSLDPTTGSSTGEMDEVTLLVDISGMSAGSYSCTINIEDPEATNSPQTASVSLTINPATGPPAPTISCSPTSFSFTATEGDPNLSDTLWIRNDGDGSLDWSVSDDADGVKDWLSLDPTTGSSTGEMDEVVLSVNIGGMVAGSYSAMITIEAAGASNTPQTVPVSLSINPPPGPPEIGYNPTSFSFTATEGDPGLSDTLWIRNDGDGTLTWTVSDDADWLSLNPTTGSSTGEMDEVVLSVDIGGMVAGSYSATITIEAAGASNTPQTVPVSLSINPPPGPPEIWYNPTSFSFTATEGDPSLSDTLWIRNDGDGTLTWSVSDDADWLSLNPTTGSSTGEMDEVVLSVNIGGMVAGSYSATITIEDPGATNSPQTASVSLTINPPPGPPEIWHNPTSFTFTATEGVGSPASFGFTATEAGDPEILSNPVGIAPGSQWVYEVYYDSFPNSAPIPPAQYTETTEWTIHVAEIGVNPVPDLEPACVNIPMPTETCDHTNTTPVPPFKRYMWSDDFGASLDVVTANVEAYNAESDGQARYVYTVSMMMGLFAANMEISYDNYTQVSGSTIGQPYEVGASWTYDQYADGSVMGSCIGPIPTLGTSVTVVAGGQTVTVPAGTFTDCFEIVTTTASGTKTEWYSPTAMGIVKAIDDNSSMLGVETRELTSYTVGGDGDPEIGYDPTSFTFTAIEGGPNPPDQTLGISNSGGGSLDWSVSDDADGVKDWLSLDPTSGTSTGETDDVTLSVDITGMSAGTYSATITIEATGATNTPKTASVDLTINPAGVDPHIWYDPTSFTFTATEGGDNPAGQSLGIMNDGGGTLEWSVSDDADWLSLDPTSDTSTGEMDDVALSVDITGMSAGSYSCTITIEDPGATNTPQTVPVSLTINPAGGANPPDQTLSIRNSGGGTLNWSVSDDADWLTLDPTSGSSTGETDDVTLSVDITGMSAGSYSATIAGMSAGSYSATITIEAPGASNTPQTVPVSLIIEYEPGGSTGPPCRFYGTVQVDGAYVPDGTLITASIAGAVLTWTTTTTSSSPESVYVLDVPGDDTLTLEKDGGVEDDVVSFTIRHGTTDLAAGSGVWHKGIPQEVNLQAATGGRSSGGGGGKSSPTEPTKPPEEPAEPAEPVVPEPEPTPTPPAPPPAPEEPSDEGGLTPGAWAGIGIGSALLLALGVWLILRRWVWVAADGEDS